MSTAETAGVTHSTRRGHGSPLLGYLKLGALGVLGLLVGAAGVVVHAGWFPGGLLLSLAALVGLCVAGTRVTGARSGAWAPGGGWALVVLPLTFWTTSEGDFLVTDVKATMLLYGGLIVIVICATMLTPTSARFGSPQDHTRSPQ